MSSQKAHSAKLFSPAFLLSARRIWIARFVSFTGSAFSELAIPLFLYEQTSNPLHIGLQWSILALSKLVSASVAPRISFFKTDRSALIGLDCAQAAVTLLPVICLPFGAAVFGTYISTFLLAFLTILQAGYIDSFVGHAAAGEEAGSGVESARSWLLGRIENGRHLGMLTGYAIAYMASAKLGFTVGFTLDALSFLVSAYILRAVVVSGEVRKPGASQPAYAALLRPELRLLTLTQLLVGFGLYTYNAGYIIALKRDMNATTAEVAALFVLQYFGYFVGSLVPSWWVERFKRPMEDRMILWLRGSVVAVFVSFALAPHAWAFIFTNFVFSAIIGASLPGSIAMFQKLLPRSELRGAGAARASLTAVSGAVGAAVASWVISSNSFRALFAYGAAIYLIAGFTLWLHLYLRATAAARLDKAGAVGNSGSPCSSSTSGIIRTT